MLLFTRCTLQAAVYKTFAEIQEANTASQKESTTSKPAKAVAKSDESAEAFDFSKYDDIDTDSESDIEANIDNDEIDEEDDSPSPEVEEEVVYIPEPRASTKVNFGFSPRLFPTPARESKQSKLDDTNIQM